MYFSRSARNTATTQSGEDRRFFDVFTSLRPYGGMQSDDELRCLQAASRSGFSLKSALLERRAFVLTWRHRLWVWAAAGSVDTDLSFLSSLELYGTEIAERRMPTRRVVEALDVIEHV